MSPIRVTEVAIGSFGQPQSSQWQTPGIGRFNSVCDLRLNSMSDEPTAHIDNRAAMGRESCRIPMKPSLEQHDGLSGARETVSSVAQSLLGPFSRRVAHPFNERRGRPLGMVWRASVAPLRDWHPRRLLALLPTRRCWRHPRPQSAA